MPSVSIIIRSKNEENWIKHCLRALKEQTFQDFEIILVDNNSYDFTVELALSEFKDLKLVKIEKYLPGKALNFGIKEARGDYIVCLSAHCIPINLLISQLLLL